MESTCYKHPPITEAVIEIRFDKVLGEKAKKALVGKYKSCYQHYAEAENIDLSVDIASNKVTNQKIGNNYRFSSSDMTEIVILRNNSITVSQLAPYKGWDDFFNRFKRDYELFHHQTSHREISRVGVRYINRIDIPVEDNKVEHEQYLNVYPMLPPLLKGISHYALNVSVELKDVGCFLTVNSGLASSPIEGHLSFIFDQDIFRQADLPASKEELFALIHRIRSKKNEIFESSITDKARSLF